MSTIEKLIEAWWKPLEFSGGTRSPLTKRVQNKKIVDAVLNGADMLGEDTEQVKLYMKMLLPKKASDISKISYFNDINKYNGGLVRHRTATTPGRFFRKVFPSAPDQLCEAFTAFYQNNIVFDQSDYILHVGNTQEDFKKAFRSYFRTQAGFDYVNGKSISDSCMRYAFTGLSDHPSVVYASGDFIVATIKSKTGKTRARVVIGVQDFGRGLEYSPNNIYASCNYSKQMLLDYLNTLNVTYFTWSGLKLLRVDSGAGRGRYLCPYIDRWRDVSIYDENYLVVGSDSYSNCNGTGGYVYFSNYNIPKTWRKAS